jgi:hypothetical protein
MPESKDRSGSWWDTKRLIAFIAVLSALVAPTVTYIVQKGELEHTITMDMLKLAVDPDLTAEGRRNVMEVLSLVITKDNLRDWAREKLAQAQEDVKLVDTLRAKLARMQWQQDSLLLLAETHGHDDDEEAMRKTIDSLDISRRMIQSQMPYQEQRSMQQMPLEESTRQRTLPDPSGRRRGGR